MISNRDKAISITLGYEGGYTNDRNDPGGPTNWGITIYDARLHWKPDATAEDVKAMPKSVAIEILRKKYWARMDCDKDPAGVDLVTFDYGANSGVGRAIPCRQHTMTTDAVVWIKAICAERLSFLKRLKTWKNFGRGWGSRVADVEARGVTMQLQSRQLSAPIIRSQLNSESKKASSQSKSHSTAATGTTAATTASQMPTVPTAINWPHEHLHQILYVSAGLTILTIVCYFMWWAYHHNLRSQAYAAVAKEI